MKKNWPNKTLILFSMLAYIALHSPVFANETSVEFIKRLEQYNSSKGTKNTAWLSAKSPWHPYLKAQFSKGLNERKKSRYLVLQSQGRCDELLKLEQKGFSSLYPEVKGVLEDQSASKIFDDILILNFSLGFRRCGVFSKLNPVFKTEREQGGNYTVNLPLVSLATRPRPGASGPEQLLRSALLNLMRLAMCDDYLPAIGDLLRLDADQLFILSGMEKYYLLRRAQFYGPDLGDLNQLARMIELDYGAFKLVKLRRALDEENLQDARKEFQHTPSKCGDPYLAQIPAWATLDGKSVLGVQLNQTSN